MSDEKGNTGNSNTGYRNTGDCNTGDWNTGYSNNGNCNTGGCNTGDCNTGNWNTGNSNTGYWNTGYWNTGDRNTGYFCTQTPPPMFFDQPSNLTWEEAREAVPYIELTIGAEWIAYADMSEPERSGNPNAEHVGGYLKECTLPINKAFPLAWAKLSDDERAEKRAAFLALPNFDHDKFHQITGVRLSGIGPSVRHAAREIVVDGVVFVPKESTS